MTSFWQYIRDVLGWPLHHAPGPLQALAQGMALGLDRAREDAEHLRRQFFSAQCEPELVPLHGQSRGVIRHPRETDDQYRQRVVQAWRWHMLGGKVQGLPEILKFFGFKALRIENMRNFSPTRWAEFQVGFGTPASSVEQQEILDNLHGLIWVINEYKPARSFFFRMYNDVFDKRPIVLSVGPKLGDGWLSHFSGVPVEDVGNGGKDTIVSFGIRNAYQSAPYVANSLCASFGSIAHYGFLAPYLDRFVVGRSKLSDVYPRNNPFVIGSLFSILWADRATTGRRWRGEWDARCWLDYTGFDRKLPPWRMERRAISRAQLVPGWSDGLGDVNARLGVTFATVIDAPMRLGEARLSLHDSQRRELRLHEMFVQTEARATLPVNPGVPVTASTAQLSVSSPLVSPERGQSARHDVGALALTPREAAPSHSAAQECVPLLCAALIPDPAPPTALTTYRAPQWMGAWTEPGRTWQSPRKIATQ